MSTRTATRPRVLRENDHRLGWQDRERAQSVRQGYEKMGWQFALPSAGLGVMVLSDTGACWYHAFADGCSCPARTTCKHMICIRDCGGVKPLREALERWP
jgi:hypothetical protein